MDYAQRRSDEDTRVPEYQAKVGRITTQYVELSRATAFEVPELLRLADQTLEEFYRQEPRAGVVPPVSPQHPAPPGPHPVRL